MCGVYNSFNLAVSTSCAGCGDKSIRIAADPVGTAFSAADLMGTACSATSLVDTGFSAADVTALPTVQQALLALPSIQQALLGVAATFACTAINTAVFMAASQSNRVPHSGASERAGAKRHHLQHSHLGR